MSKRSVKQKENPVWIHYMPDGSLAWLHESCPQVDQSGVNGMRFWIQPTDRHVIEFKLIKGIHIDEEGLVTRWYPMDCIIFPPITDPQKKWVFITCNFNGFNDVFIPKISELKRKNFYLEQTNKKLMEENFRLNRVGMNILRGDRESVKLQMEVMNEFRKVSAPPKDEGEGQEEFGDQSA